MKKTLIALAVFALSSTAMAGNCGNGVGNGNACEGGNNENTNINVNDNSNEIGIRNSNENTNVNLNNAESRSYSSSKAIGVGVGVGLGVGVGGDSKAVSISEGGTASASNAGNTLTIEGSTYVHKAQQRDPVHSAVAPSIEPTALCAIGVSGAVQGVSVGISMGTSYVDENCVRLEQVRMVAGVLGDLQTANEMMCDVPAYRAARERIGKPCSVVATPNQQPTSAAPKIVSSANSDLYR